MWKAALQAVPSERKLKQFRFIRQPEYRTYWEGIGKGVSSNVILRLPDQSIGGGLASTHHLYDFRAAGILSYMEFGRGELERASR